MLRAGYDLAGRLAADGIRLNSTKSGGSLTPNWDHGIPHRFSMAHACGR